MRPAVIAGAALLAGLAACALVLSSDHMADRVVWAVFGPVVGWSFIGTGLYASRRRPESRFGALMVAARLHVAAGAARRCRRPVAVRARDRARLVVGAGARARAAQLPVRAADRRRPARRGDRRLCPRAARARARNAGRASPTVLADCDGPCPREPAARSRDDERLGEILFAAGSAVVMTLCLMVVGMLIARWRAAGTVGAPQPRPAVRRRGDHAAAGLRLHRDQGAGLQDAGVPRVRRDAVRVPGRLARADVAQARGVRSLVARLSRPAGARRSARGARGRRSGTRR